jgi:hypothetical protein
MPKVTRHLFVVYVPGMKPSPTEPICLISFEVTAILLNGGPEDRPSFWKAYRRELELNQKTNYDNYHVAICREHLKSLKLDLKTPVYYRNGRLTTEREVAGHAPAPLLPGQG